MAAYATPLWPACLPARLPACLACSSPSAAHRGSFSTRTAAAVAPQRAQPAQPWAHVDQLPDLAKHAPAANTLGMLSPEHCTFPKVNTFK
jgi:hypothetical protein